MRVMINLWVEGVRIDGTDVKLLKLLLWRRRGHRHVALEHDLAFLRLFLRTGSLTRGHSFWFSLKLRLLREHLQIFSVQSILLFRRLVILSTRLVGETYKSRGSYVARVERRSIAVSCALTSCDSRHTVMSGANRMVSSRRIPTQNAAIICTWGHSGGRSLLQRHISKITVIACWWSKHTWLHQGVLILWQRKFVGLVLLSLGIRCGVSSFSLELARRLWWLGRNHASCRRYGRSYDLLSYRYLRWNDVSNLSEWQELCKNLVANLFHVEANRVCFTTRTWFSLNRLVVCGKRVPLSNAK